MTNVIFNPDIPHDHIIISQLNMICRLRVEKNIYILLLHY